MGISDRVTDDSRFKKNIPGPGQYDSLRSSMNEREHAPKFGGQKRLTLDIDKTLPGPGQYTQTAYYNGSIANNPQISFSKSSRSQSMASMGPGPASYNIHDEISDAVSKNKGISMKFRTKEHAEDPKLYPGPGQYQTESMQGNKKSSPAFSISKEPKLKI